jgi:hypothetical protein
LASTRTVITDTSPDDQGLCRKKKDWAEERTKANVGYDEVLSKKRTTTNSQVALSVIDELLKIVADGNMFTYEETEQMIETGMHEWYEGMPDLWTNSC